MGTCESYEPSKVVGHFERSMRLIRVEMQFC